MNLLGNILTGGGILPMPPIPGLDGGGVPDLPGLLGLPPLPGMGGDQNAVAPAAVGAPAEAVNFDNIALPPGAAGVLDKAGAARVQAGAAAMAQGDFAGAATNFTKGAEDFEKEADALLAGIAPAAAGGGAPAAASTPVAGGGAPVGGAPAGADAASPWTVKTNNLDPAKGSWSSTGDPHEVSGDGLKFDNQKTGKFDLVQSASGDFRVQNDQSPDASGRWPGATLNHAVAVKDGADVVAYDGVKKTLNVNGKETAMPTPGNPITLPGGGKIEATADGIKMTSSKGDTVDVHQRDGYIDLNGQLGPNRKDDEVRGGIGEFHDENDTNRDLKGRTGDDVIGKPGDAGAIDKFEEAWRAKDDLFPKPATTVAGGGAPTTNCPPDWTVKTNALTANNTFSSTGDPHEVTGDGLKFDNQKTGQFDLLRSATGDLVVQNEQGPDKTGRWPGATLNHKVAVKDGSDVVKYDGESKTLNINGTDTPLPKAGEKIALPGGGSVEGTADGIKVNTHKNDQIEIHQGDGYLNINGKLGDRKDDEVRGGLGEFHMENDQNRDLKGRTGDDVIGKPGDAASLDKFEETWRVQPGQSLLDAKPAAAAGGGAPVGGGAPAADNGTKMRAAISALDKAGQAHLKASRAKMAAGDFAGAAKEMTAAATDFEKEAAVIGQLPKGGAVAGGGLPPATPATHPQHVARVKKHHHRGFFQRLAAFAGGVTRSMLKQPGAIFNPIQMTMNVAGAAQEAAV